jgi:hypothetical protein
MAWWRATQAVLLTAGAVHPVIDMQQDSMQGALCWLQYIQA